MNRYPIFTRVQNRILANLSARIDFCTTALIKFIETYPELNEGLKRELYECVMLAIKLDARLVTLQYYHSESTLKPEDKDG